MSESIIVSYDFNKDGKDEAVIIVARNRNDKYDIINVIQGKEAIELYAELMGHRKNHSEDDDVAKDNSLTKFARPRMATLPRE
jgi:hypothetical protein